MVIPGHGRNADEADVVEYRDMITIIRDRIDAMIKEGMTLPQINAAAPTADYDGRYGTMSGAWTTVYYDTAQFTDFLQLGALKGLVGATQIVFGADYPYSTIVNHVEQLKNAGMTAAELAGIDRENALRILPKYR